MKNMKKFLSLLLVFSTSTHILAVIPSEELRKNPMVAMEIVVEPDANTPQSQQALLITLFAQKAPLTSRNFLNYVQDHFYDGSIFHRMIPNFMIQGGGYTPSMQEKTTRPAISNEASQQLKNLKGTLAMARNMEVDSATSQFFINFQDNAFLDHRDDSSQGFGYAVFGQVIDGLDKLTELQSLPTHQVGPYADVPSRQILIKRIYVLSGEEKTKALAKIARLSQVSPTF